jgi:hypothetical protein
VATEGDQDIGLDLDTRERTLVQEGFESDEIAQAQPVSVIRLSAVYV